MGGAGLLPGWHNVKLHLLCLPALPSLAYNKCCVSAVPLCAPCCAALRAHLLMLCTYLAAQHSLLSHTLCCRSRSCRPAALRLLWPRYDDERDEELLRLLPFLEQLAGVDDVRPAIASQFKLRQLVDATPDPQMRRCGLGSLFAG